MPEPTGDARSDALAELRWAMAGHGLTVQKTEVMNAVRHLPLVAHALAGVEPHAVPRAVYDVLVAAVLEFGDGLHARLLRNSLAVGYGGGAKDLTARRLEFVTSHNEGARTAGSRNVLPETTRALYAIEQQLLEALVTALGAPAEGGAVPQTVVTSRADAPVVPRQLPAAPARFCGRAPALERLDATTFGTVAIHGTAGVGKSALALHWAHRVADRFVDGQLYLDLHGHTRGADPMPVTTALGRLLGALGIPTDTLPADAEQLAGVYRTATAGRRLLVVLDNATSPDQVASLVPGSPECLVVVTSRNALHGLAVTHGAAILTLDALSPDEALALFESLLGAERTAAEPDAAAEVARLCGYLPLALRIVGAKLQAEPEATLADMASRLRATDRLTALGFGDDGEVAVRAAFALSYESLADECRAAFRILGLLPGRDVAAEGAAALFGTDVATAERLLDRLAAAHLVSRTPRDRVELHDLLRDYAAERCLATDPEPVRQAAVRRLLAYYTHRAAQAVLVLNPRSLHLADEVPDDPAPEPFADRPTAVEWLAVERANLVSAVLHAAAQGDPNTVWRLAYAMRAYFLVGISGSDWLPVGEAALAAATTTGNEHAVSAMHGLLGRARRLLGDLDDAAWHLEQAIAASRSAGWTAGEIVGWCTLGGIRQDQGRLTEAIGHHEAALALERRSGDPDGGATHLANIGTALSQIGRFSDAADYFAHVLEISRRRGDERGVALAYEALGRLGHEFGKLHDAAADVDRALAEFRRLGFRDLEAECLATLARVRCDLGDTAGARAYALASLRLARALDDVRVEIVAANTLGEVTLRAGDADEAEQRHRSALALAVRAGYRPGRVGALVGLAATTVAGGGAATGRALAEEALAEARDAGLLALEGHALTVLASAVLALGDRVGATEHATTAHDIFLRCGSRLGAASAEQVLAAAR